MRRIGVLSLGNFFAAAHFFLIIYILAPYLATLVPENVAGLAISLGAVFTLTFFPSLPRLAAKYGPQKLGVWFGFAEILILLGLALSPNAFFAVLLAALACAVSPFIAYQLDLLLESAVEDENSTGRVRAAFLTAGNVSLVLAPMVTGYLLADSERYNLVFLVAALSLIPFMLLLRHVPAAIPAPPRRINLRDACLCLMNDKDLRAIALAYGVIQFFFHLAPLYIPLYLHNVLGIPWSELGWMFAVMLLPFVLLEYPAGWLADTKLGDKRILAAGFVLTGLALAAIGTITETTSLTAILAILVLSRVGSALVEAIAEGHFFRRVSANDANTVSLFRMLRPVGALTAPIVGSLLLSVSGYTTFFAVTGFFVLVVGFFASLSVRDLRHAAQTTDLETPPLPPSGAPKGRG